MARLDGLPLAIELAAARVRTMSVEEVRRRLGDLFGLLRTRDRSAPERHRTLAAVIEWSWDLLDPDAQEAMARLSVFHDGFTRDTAVAALGDGGADLVETLAEQSLVTVGEVDGSTRFRMLETVREFAADRLTTRACATTRSVGRTPGRRPWSTARRRLFGPDEIAAVDDLGAEENNLTDVLRRAFRDGDRRAGRAAARLPGRALDDHRQPPPHVRHRRRGRGGAGRLGPARGAAHTAQIVVSWLMVHLSWMPHRSIDSLRGQPCPVGRAPASVGEGRVHDVRRGGVPGVPAAERVAALAGTATR